MAFDGLREEVCCNVACGVRYAVPEHVYQQARRVGKERAFHCPNGHSQFYVATEEERLKARVASLEREVADLGSRNERHALSLVYWKGMATRWKRKACSP